MEPIERKRAIELIDLSINFKSQKYNLIPKIREMFMNYLAAVKAEVDDKLMNYLATFKAEFGEKNVFAHIYAKNAWIVNTEEVDVQINDGEYRFDCILTDSAGNVLKYISFTADELGSKDEFNKRISRDISDIWSEVESEIKYQFHNLDDLIYKITKDRTALILQRNSIQSFLNSNLMKGESKLLRRSDKYGIHRKGKSYGWNL